MVSSWSAAGSAGSAAAQQQGSIVAVVLCLHAVCRERWQKFLMHLPITVATMLCLRPVCRECRQISVHLPSMVAEVLCLHAVCRQIRQHGSSEASGQQQHSRAKQHSSSAAAV